MKRLFASTVFVVLSLLLPVAAQTNNGVKPEGLASGSVSAEAAQVPRQVKFSGTVPNFSTNEPDSGTAGGAATTLVGMTFSLYSQQAGGAALWSEVQNVHVDQAGHYTVQLGSAAPGGLPVELFTSAQAQWLGVRQEDHAEQARVMLLSVPYALKAADAETFGGKPPSAYMPASADGSGSAAGVGGVGTPQSTGGSQSAPSVGGGGTTNYIAVWTSSSNLGSSAIYQSGINVGIGTTAPTHPLVVVDPSHSGTAIVATATGTGGQGIRGVTNSSAGIGVFGSAASTSGGIGVQGNTVGTAGTGVLGNATATTGNAVGVKGSTASTSGYGVFGNATATSGNTYGVYGAAASTSGQAVLGSATATTGNTSGVGGYSASNAGYGVYGEATANSGSTFGTYGKADSTSGTGLVGYATASSGSTLGVWGYVQSSSGTAGLFNNSAGGNILVGENNSSIKFTVHGNGDLSIAGNYSGGGSGLTGITFGQLNGQLASTQLAGTYSGVLNLSNAGNSYSGSGANLTGLSFQNLSGTLRSSQLSGTYSGALTLSNTSNSFSGTSLSLSGSGTANGGLSGYSSTATGSGVIGTSTVTGAAGYGVYGQSASSSGIGVYGASNASTGNAYGVYGTTGSSGGTAVNGYATATAGVTYGVAGQSVSTSGTGVYGNASAISGNTNGVAGYAASNNGFGVAGYATSTSGSTVGVSGQSMATGTASAGVLGQSMATTGTVYGVQGTSVSTSGIGVVGSNTASSGSTYGVEGVAGSPNGFGVLGKEVSTTGPAVGAGGSTLSMSGVGVYGVAIGASQTSVTQAPSAVWGNTNANGGVGVLGTNDDGIAVEGANNAGNIATASFTNNESTNFSGAVFVAHGSHYGGICLVDVSGHLDCNGTLSAVVPVEAGTHQVALYAVEAPENWFEDVGSGHLAGGSAVVQLETTFAQTVNTGEEYHVFLTPNGDCKGLYVTNKTAASFEVRELGGGTASIAFDYRIIARRRGYESVRLADNTERFAAIASGDHAVDGVQPVKAPTVPEAGMPPVNQKQFVPPPRQIAVPPAPAPSTRQATVAAPPVRH